MYRPVLNVLAGGSLALAIALQPAIAAAAPNAAAANAAAAESPATVSAPITRPFDPMCPLCFVREFIESGSAR
ncbi:hypothetical protein [Nocardia sp. NPDC005978]|uniref:hypothetical protein n=1 Tax=unclassified Nocardia TaxID=2637762 RepID=UPI0033AA9BF2